ncbi:MAG: DUF302 domain-containing protein [Symbiobacteriia bacterium]
MDFFYSVPTSKTVDEAIDAVKENAGKAGFRVLHIHNVTATLAEKGFNREELRIIEVCHAPSLNRILDADINIAYFTPCKINVYAQDGQVHLGTMRPTMMSQFFPGAEIADVAQSVESALMQILASSR